MRPLRVLLVNDCPLEAGGGAELHIVNLMAALRKLGHEPFFLAAQERGSPARYGESGHFLLPHFDAPLLRKSPVENLNNLRRSVHATEELLRRIRPDVIHVHNLLNPFPLRSLLRAGCVVKSIHDCRPFCAKPHPDVASRLVGTTGLPCHRVFGLGCFSRCYIPSGGIPRSLKDLIEALSFFPRNWLALKRVLNCDRLIVYSRYLYRLAAKMFPDPRRIAILDHFTDFPVIDSAEHRFPRDRKILFVGRFSHEKGIFHLLEAVERIPLSFEAVFVGRGPSIGELKYRSTNLPGKTVRILDYLPHDRLVEMYRQCTVVVVPSIGSEGCPLVGIEALANGRPVVGFDTGGVSEWLLDGVTGYLVERGNVPRFAERIQRLLENESLAKAMGSAGMNLIATRFHEDRHLERLLEVYEQAISSSSRR